MKPPKRTCKRPETPDLAIGFGLYRYLLNADTPLGVTFPVIVAVMVMDVVVSKIVVQSKNRADLK